MEPTVCSECGQELQIGDYPFCKNGSGHESIYESNAQRFDPIILHKSATGEYSFPGHSSDPTPAGFERIEIKNMRQAEHYTREINSIERGKMSDKRELNRLYFEEKTKDRREGIDAEMKRRGLSGRALELAMKARAYADKKHDRRFSSARAFGANFHIQALEFNQSNRMPYAGPETGYKDRRS